MRRGEVIEISDTLKMSSKMPLAGPSLAIFIISMVMMILSIVAVSMRTFVRLYVVRAFGWDDILMLSALVGSQLKTRTGKDMSGLVFC
jgi:hypothetical protein